MVLGSYYLGLCRFGFRGLCDDWGTNRVICGYGIRICGVECVSDFVSVGFFFVVDLYGFVKTVVGGGLREAVLVVFGGLREAVLVVCGGLREAVLVVCGGLSCSGTLTVCIHLSL